MTRLLCRSYLALVAFGFGTIGPVLAQDQVLVGTDVVERSSFSVQQVSQSVEGAYVSDQGGAVLTGKLSKDGPDWQFVRAFAEPGTEPITKAYSLVESETGLHSQRGDIQILPLNDAILVLELSTDELVPSDLWIFYERKE